MKSCSPKGLWLGLILLLFAIGSTALVFLLRPEFETSPDPESSSAKP